MDIRELEIFLTLADLLHFARASQQCHLSPSALTRTVQRLEDELQQPLFVRDRRSVQLTDAGRHFQQYARQALHDYAVFARQLDDSGSPSGTLSLFASITAVYSVLPDLVEAYRQTYTAVQLELHSGAAEDALQRVESGEIDIAVAALPDRRQRRTEFLPILTTELIFIADPLLAQEFVDPHSGHFDLAEVPLVLPQTGLSRRRLDQWLKKHSIQPNISSEVSGNEALIALVHLGCGIGVVPKLVWERSPFKDQVQVLAQAPQLEPYIVGLCSSQQNLQKPAVAAFWQLAKQRGDF